MKEEIKNKGIIRYTPGPWRVEYEGAQNGRSGQYWIMGGDGLNVVTVIRGGGSEPAKDNARLIASSPDLLLAAKEAVLVLVDIAKETKVNVNNSPVLKHLFEAITKAEGSI